MYLVYHDLLTERSHMSQCMRLPTMWYVRPRMYWVYHDLLTERSHMSQCMRLPTMWYVRPAKPQISLRIRTG